MNLLPGETLIAGGHHDVLAVTNSRLIAWGKDGSGLRWMFVEHIADCRCVSVSTPLWLVGTAVALLAAIYGVFGPQKDSTLAVVAFLVAVFCAVAYVLSRYSHLEFSASSGNSISVRLGPGESDPGQWLEAVHLAKRSASTEVRALR